jgi:YidC/Oxa1 family membrane protein insertase
MNETRNLILTITLSIAIILGWSYFFPDKARIAPAPQQQNTPQKSGESSFSSGTGIQSSAPLLDNEDISPQSYPRIAIESPELSGSINLVGGRLDDLSLSQFHETPDPKSKRITLLSPATGTGAYYIESGWLVDSGEMIKIPDSKTLWKADHDKLTPSQALTLQWDNGQGQIFTRRYEVDSNFLFTVTETVINSSASPIILYPFARVARFGTPEVEKGSAVHAGAIGVINGTLKELSYSDMRDSKKLSNEKSVGGWLGITDKYWLTALIPDQTLSLTANYSYGKTRHLDRYQTDWVGETIEIGAHQTTSLTNHLFTGAKELSKLDAYSKALSVPHLGRAIDFGIFYFIAEPFFYILKIIHQFVPNFGIVILIFTILVRALLFPIANKQYKSMAKMKVFQPQLKELQERYHDDKMRLQQETMALYKKEGVNPIAGCLPLILQIPVMFALYKVLYVSLEMRQAPFFGWIHDLSIADPTTIFNLFGLIPWTPPEMLHLGAWPLVMGLTMFLQQKLSPTPIADPVQAKVMAFLPVIFTFMFGQMPAGLVIYWAWGNFLSIAQQWLITRQYQT